MNRTENFIWYQKDVISCGTRAMIYKGFHRLSGEFVAIKVNKTLSDVFPRGLLSLIDEDEIRLVKDLRHKNLVEFIGFERIEESTEQSEFIGEQVLLFEFCHGQSVELLLQSPTFRYGLPFPTVMNLLSDLNEALRYLKTKNILHTDIRPENLLQSIDSNGKQTFKLTDLKKAQRILHENRRSKSLISSSNVDFWPLAVTIFQCLTGNLPIESFSTKSMDRTRLQRLWQTKPLESLCGIEISADGDVQWSKTFPKSTRLPLTLQVAFESLLINAFNIEPNWLRTFDDFLDEIEMILHLIPIHYTILDRFFSTCNYFSNENSIENFFQHVQHETNVTNPIEYKIFFNHHIYFVKPSTTIKEFCSQLPFGTSRECPLILYPISSLNFYSISLKPIYLPCLRRQINESTDLSSLVDLSNELLGLIYFLKRFITDFDQTLRTIDSGLQTMHRYLKMKSFELLSLIREKCVDYRVIREIDEVYRSNEEKIIERPRRHRTKSLVKSNDDDEPFETDRPIIYRANQFFRQLNSFERQLTTLIDKNLNCRLFNEEILRNKSKENFSLQNQRIDRQIEDATMFNKTFRIPPANPNPIQRVFYQTQRKYLENLSERFFHFVHHDCEEFVEENVQNYSQRIRKQTNTFEEIQYFQLAYEDLLNEAISIDEIRQAVEHFIHSNKRNVHLIESLDLGDRSSFTMKFIDENPLTDSIRLTLRSTIEQAKENSISLQSIVDILQRYSDESVLL